MRSWPPWVARPKIRSGTTTCAPILMKSSFRMAPSRSRRTCASSVVTSGPCGGTEPSRPIRRMRSTRRGLSDRYRCFSQAGRSNVVETVGGGAAEAVRAVLDRYDVGGRLQYIRDFIWRGGTLELRVAHGGDGQIVNVWYALTAEWPAAMLERDEITSPGIVSRDLPVVEGRWVRGSSGYELRVGIDLCGASAIYVRSQ